MEIDVWWGTILWGFVHSVKKIFTLLDPNNSWKGLVGMRMPGESPPCRLPCCVATWHL